MIKLQVLRLAETPVVEPERGARVGDEPEVGAADGRDQQHGAGLGIHSLQPPAERVGDRPRHSERQTGLEALDHLEVGGAQLEQRERIAVRRAMQQLHVLVRRRVRRNRAR